MTRTGPQLDRLTHRLSECPPDFLAEPLMGRKGVIHVDAVVNDLILDLGGTPLSEPEMRALLSSGRSRNLLRLSLVAAWLLHDDWFRQDAACAGPARAWLQSGLDPLAAIVTADLFVSDPDRREELARACLAALSLKPDGETDAMAEDRLRTLDSVERIQLLRETREQQERARKLREAMKKKEAEEAAAKATRE